MNYALVIAMPIVLVVVSLIFIQGYFFGTKITPGSGSYKITAIIVCIVGISLVLFLSWVSAGTAICDGYKSTCMSKIFNISLPGEFCSENVQPCECISDQDCQKIGCNRCINGTCLPFSGSRGKTATSVRKLNMTILIFSIILAVILPMIFYFGMKGLGRDPGMINTTLSIILIIILCALFPIASYVQPKTVTKLNPTC